MGSSLEAGGAYLQGGRSTFSSSPPPKYLTILAFGGESIILYPASRSESRVRDDMVITAQARRWDDQDSLLVPTPTPCGDQEGGLLFKEASWLGLSLLFFSTKYI